jgi:hypothetical protein
MTGRFSTTLPRTRTGRQRKKCLATWKFRGHFAEISCQQGKPR